MSTLSAPFFSFIECAIRGDQGVENGRKDHNESNCSNKIRKAWMRQISSKMIDEGAFLNDYDGASVRRGIIQRLGMGDLYL